MPESGGIGLLNLLAREDKAYVAAIDRLLKRLLAGESKSMARILRICLGG